MGKQGDTPHGNFKYKRNWTGGCLMKERPIGGPYCEEDEYCCKYGIREHTNELGEKEIFCKFYSRWVNVTLGNCIGNCATEANVDGK